MSTRFFGLNSLAGALRSSGSVVEVTTAGRFDAAYVANAIQAPAPDTIIVTHPFMDGSTSIAVPFWLRFDTFQEDINSGAMLTMLNGGVNAYRIASSGTTSGQVQYWNSGTSAWVNWGATFAYTHSVNDRIGLKLTPNVGYELFIAGTPVASSAVVPTNGAAAVDEFRFGSMHIFQSGFFSQIMCADYNIIDSHYMAKLPNAEGTYATDGTGAYTDVNEVVLNDGTAINLAAVGNHRSFTKAAIAVPLGLQIAGMVVNARGRLGGGSVADGKILCKQGGSDSLSGVKGYNASFFPRGHFFATDPATASPFSEAGFNSAEPGFAAA